MRRFESYTFKELRAVLLVLLFAFVAHAQEVPDSSQVALSDSLVLNKEKAIVTEQSKHNIRRATLLSVAVPGTGQIYNRKWWKAPIVYAGLGTTIFLAISNQQDYRRYSNAFDIRQAGGEDEFDGRLNNQQLVSNMRFHQGNRDLSILFAFVVYGVNIIDANVDAHLFDFDVSDDLSIRITPTYRNTPWGAHSGLALTFNF
ncbi:MAG: DUF5683 domain-containing protein [Schleiferiaceae bacterium]|nr:DUF5683 domain-containing protein [Schleiferiaceae bacterium]